MQEKISLEETLEAFSAYLTEKGRNSLRSNVMYTI